MSNATIRVDQFLSVKNFGRSCLTSIFYLAIWKWKSKRVKPDQVCEIWRFLYLFFSSDWYLPVASWFRLVIVSQDAWVQIQHGVKLLHPICHFVWHWARQLTDTRHYIAALSMIVFFSNVSSGDLSDRVITLDMNIRLPQFWSTWSLALGQDLPVALPSLELFSDWPSFSLNCGKYCKNEGQPSCLETFRRLMPQVELPRDISKAHAQGWVPLAGKPAATSALGEALRLACSGWPGWQHHPIQVESPSSMSPHQHESLRLPNRWTRRARACTRCLLLRGWRTK